jgi:hypothetical protein
LLHFLGVHPELLPRVQGGNGVQETTLLLIVRHHRVVSFLGDGEAAVMVLQMHGQVITFLSDPTILLAQRYSSIIMEAGVPKVHPGHHRVALEVEGLPAIFGWQLLPLLAEGTLALGLLLGATLQVIFQNVVYNILLFGKLLELAHPPLIIATVVADPGELKDSHLLPMVEVQVLARIIERVTAAEATIHQVVSRYPLLEVYLPDGLVVRNILREVIVSFQSFLVAIHQRNSLPE